jgi:hypothetical protein
MWPIQCSFLLFIACRKFLFCSTLGLLPYFSHDRSNWSSPSFSIILHHYISKIFTYFSPNFRSVLSFITIQCYAPNVELSSFSFKLSPICWWKESSICWIPFLPWQCWL